MNNISNDLLTILPYENLINIHKAVKEDGNFDRLCDLQKFNRIYLFPENMHEGVEMTSFISAWIIGDLFIVTEKRGCNMLYKKFGADYVIISKPQSSFSWLPNIS